MPYELIVVLNIAVCIILFGMSIAAFSEKKEGIAATFFVALFCCLAFASFLFYVSSYREIETKIFKTQVIEDVPYVIIDNDVKSLHKMGYVGNFNEDSIELVRTKEKRVGFIYFSFSSWRLS